MYGLEVLSEEGLLAAGAGETVQLWDLNRATRTSLAAFTATESGVHFGGLRNPDRKAFVFSIAARGRILSAALSDGSLRLLDSETLQELATLCVSNEAPSLATAPLGPPRAILGTLGYSRVISAHLGYPQLISGSSLMALRRPPSPPPSR